MKVLNFALSQETLEQVRWSKLNALKKEKEEY